jgi:predicted transcriptional regulator
VTFSAIVLVRGRKDIAAQVLEVVVQKPDTAPTRIFGKIGVSYRFLQAMLENGLIHLEPKGRRRFKVSITESGREFLAHYRACNKLFPING